MPQVEGITINSGGKGVVVLVCENNGVWKVQSWSCSI